MISNKERSNFSSELHILLPRSNKLRLHFKATKKEFHFLNKESSWTLPRCTYTFNYVNFNCAERRKTHHKQVRNDSRFIENNYQFIANNMLLQTTYCCCSSLDEWGTFFLSPNPSSRRWQGNVFDGLFWGRSVDDDAGVVAVAAESVCDACLLAKMMTLLLWYMRFLSWLGWLVAWIWHIKNFQSLSLGRIVILGQYYCCLLTCSLAVVLVIQPCNAFLL